MGEVRTCPRCGALIVPQLARCRQCKAYLHGTALEGLLVDLLPERYAHAPGTMLAVISIMIYYMVMVARAGPGNLIGFGGFTLKQLGALDGPDLLDGQHWRYVTYMFGHHDIVHLAFNLYALIASGVIVEQLFDRKKMFLMYLASGVAAGLGSLVYYVFIKGGAHLVFVSAGASGAVSGMIGAALFGARRQGTEGKEMAQRMLKWALLMVVWGFAVPGINNAAHFSGFLAGAGLARAIPLGATDAPRARTALSVLVFAALALVVACGAKMIQHQRGFPVALANDAQSRDILGLVYFEGVDFEGSDQKRIWDECMNSMLVDSPPVDLLHACELNARVNAHDRRSFTELADLVAAQGDAARAARLRGIAARLQR